MKKRFKKLDVDSGSLCIIDKKFLEQYGYDNSEDGCEEYELEPGCYEFKVNVTHDDDDSDFEDTLADILTTGTIVVGDPCYVIKDEDWDRFINDTDFSRFYGEAGFHIETGGDGTFNLDVEFEKTLND